MHQPAEVFVRRSNGRDGNGAQPEPGQHGAAGRARPAAAGERHGQGRRRHADADVDPQAAGLRRRRRNGRWSYLVHGGPQGAWEDGWSFRWNPQLWAAQGYVVALPNPRGSTGFGQKYVDEISGDWGGKCYEDLMAGVDYLEKLPYIDKDRMAAAGASFGGYMMNWFAGQHRPSSRR